MRKNQLSQESTFRMSWTLILLFGGALTLNAQDQPATTELPANRAARPVIEIPDQPTTVDPATLVSPVVAVPVTVEFDGVPLKSVFKWLQQDQSINLLVDDKALVDAKVLDTEPVYERLKDSPLYLLLNRLQSLGIAWYVRDKSLYLTSLAEIQKVDRTLSYYLGDLFDAGYSSEALLRTIVRCSGGRWEGNVNGDDSSSILLLGDVAFIRQTDTTHLEISGLLTALRKHGRRTLTLDSPRHAEIRAAMEAIVTVDFQETPLILAVQTLADQAKIDLRVDRVALAKSTVRERSPVTLKQADQKLGAVLRSILSNLQISSYLRDEVLWITTNEAASRFRKTAVFDVRDLCRDQTESKALKEALQKQSRADWRPTEDAAGAMEVPIPGVLVVRHMEKTLDEVSQLLENYRTALRASKVRKVPVADPTEVVAGYYRLPRPMAEDLKAKLPKLIAPGTWQSNESPDAAGSIVEVSIDAKGGASGALDGPPGSTRLTSENQVLIIRQTRAVHRLIGELIQTLTEAGKFDVKAAGETGMKAAVRPINFGSGLLPAP